MTLSDAAGSSACVRWAGERPDLGCLSRIRAKLPKIVFLTIPNMTPRLDARHMSVRQLY
jgi:hypothetical protein